MSGGGAAAAAYQGGAVVCQNLYMVGKDFGGHGVDSLAGVVDKGHAGVWFGDYGDGYVFADVSDDRYQLVGAYVAVDSYSGGAGAFKGYGGFDSVSSGENASVCFYSYGA